MHEFSLTQNLLCTALKKAASKRIVRLHLLIGPFSEEREESIRFYWRDLAKGSPGEGAILHFEHPPTELKCLDCSGAFYLDAEGSMCRYCYNEGLPWASGEDVRIEGMELE
jgi:Zn finger protein HypA/HybF involved in hydrogenase expression